MISDPSLAANTRLLLFEMIQPGVITGPSTGHSTLRSYLYIIGLTGSALFRKFWADEETSDRVMCQSRAVARNKISYRSTFFVLIRVV